MLLIFICTISTLPPPIFLSLFTGAIGALSYVGTARHKRRERFDIFMRSHGLSPLRIGLRPAQFPAADAQGFH